MQNRNIADSIITYKTDIRHIIEVFNRSFLLLYIWIKNNFSTWLFGH